MATGELFIGAFITVLFEKLASGDLIRLARSAGIYSELNKWTDTLTQIQAVLVDAGQKHIEEKSIQVWLNKLQHLAYEIDDVLDDLATEAMRQQLNREFSASTSKVLKFIPNKLHAFKYGHKMSSKLDEITTKLLHLLKEKELLGLNKNVKRSSRASRRLEDTSVVDESKILGREGDKGALLEKLLGSESSSSRNPNVNVVSIVGLGGIGKTTLAQLLYNDKKVKDHFELKAWVCVSDEFDIFNISKAIFKDVGGDDRKFGNLNQLQVALTEKLSKKRFLLVLDDVWNENYNEWELLQRPFYVGALGSKILVTTRKTMVSSVMNSVQTYPLKLLSYEEALTLFAQYALGKPNFDSRPAIKLHGEGIVKKCGGLPLALRTLGWVLRTKSNDEDWEELLNSELWNSHNGSQILPALRLSYYDLPQHLKQMFVYCCLFPKDYMFDKDELILLWMAEGFLGQPTGDKLMESFGGECFEELVSRSFFQYSTNNNLGYKMHDLINDLAMSVAGEFFFMLDNKMDSYDKNKALDKLQHLSFIREINEPSKKFKAIQRARRLRTVLAMSVTRLSWWESFNVPMKVLTELLPRLQFLRVLSLAYYDITEVPQSIGRLKHMRYLNFSNSQIRCLPEQVGDLINLQSLLLSGCLELSSLPNSIGKLINLRHLDIKDTQRLNKMPLGLGGLTCLQTLSRVIIGGAGECRISELKGMLHLRGQLSIEGLHNVKDVVHAKEVNLHKKKRIYDLKMMWSDVVEDSPDGKTEYEVLKGLRPSEKLASLEIVYYGGPKFPSWVGDPSFDCLTQLKLTMCRSCTCLPTLGQLPSLQELFVESIDGLKTLGLELLGPSNSWHCVPFPSLELLEFKDMKSWVEWSTTGDDTAGAFPCLRQMSITNCPNLDVVAMELIPSLRVLKVKGCSLAVLRSIVAVSSSIATLKMYNIKGLTQIHGEVLEHLKAVEDLSIWCCNEVTYLWESEAMACDILVNLQRLQLGNCARLASLGEREGHLKTDMKSVRQVTIVGCPRLERYMCPKSVEKLEIRESASLVSLGEKEDHLKMGIESVTEAIIGECLRLESYNCPNNIERLYIYSCPSLTSLTFPTTEDLPSTLKSLTITHCDNMDETWLLSNFLSSVEFLSISRMLNVRLFPEECFAHLIRLTIDGCDNIVSIPDNGYGFLPFLCLRHLEIKYCKNLKSFPHEQLQNLTFMVEMEIRSCPTLDFPFPSGSWPPNLTSLEIGGLKNPVSEWGLQNFPTSLATLWLHGGENSDGVVSFGAKAEEEEEEEEEDISSFIIPSSLIELHISDFKELESVSKVLQHLTCLQRLDIRYCPKLRDLPETVLPSLSSLILEDCSQELEDKCSRSRKGKYWPIISKIPEFYLISE